MDRFDLAMIHEELSIGKWHIDFLFAPKGYDTEEALMYLYDADATDDILVRAYHILEDGDDNTGFTYTNSDMKSAVVVIGPTTSGAEFVNSLVHEIYHIATAIAGSIGYDLRGENPAYMIGDSAMELAQVICDLGCDECRK